MRGAETRLDGVGGRLGIAHHSDHPAWPGSGELVPWIRSDRRVGASMSRVGLGGDAVPIVGAAGMSERMLHAASPTGW